MNEIDNITLSYFANKSQYISILKKTEENNDKKFIKKFEKLFQRLEDIYILLNPNLEDFTPEMEKP